MTVINNFSVNRSTPNDLVWDDESNEYVSSSDMYRVTRIDSTTFSGNENIVSVDLHNIPWVNNSMLHAFGGCTNLIHINNINNTVTDMSKTFTLCTSLVNVPVIPNSVTNMYWTFRGCENLVNVPTIPDSVTNMVYAFAGCSSLVNAPVIGNGVTNMQMAFYGTSNLQGNIYIYSNQVADAGSCFTVLPSKNAKTKNVYIPFTYDNGVNTLTYNSFIAAGYDTNGTKERVYLKPLSYIVSINATPNDAMVLMADKSDDCSVDVTDWVYTENDDTCELQSYSGSDTDITVPSIYTETSSLETEKNHVVEYVVSKEGYNTVVDSTVSNTYKTIDVVLTPTIDDEHLRFTIQTLPIDSNITLSAPGYTQEGNYIIVPKGTEVSYTISKEHYNTSSGSVIVNNNIKKLIHLEPIYYTLTINTYPKEAELKIYVNDILKNNQNSEWIYNCDINGNVELYTYNGSDIDLTIPFEFDLSNTVQAENADIIKWYASLGGITKSGTLSLTEDTTIDVLLGDEYTITYDETEYTASPEEGYGLVITSSTKEDIDLANDFIINKN